MGSRREPRALHRLGALVALCLIFPVRVGAEPRIATVVEQISASPDAPAFGFIWRKAPRAILSTTLPLVGAGDDATFGLRLTPFVEIYNNPGSLIILPNENWRGRLAAELWRLWAASDISQAPWFRAGIAYEHESDHSSVRVDEPKLVSAFRTLNDLNLRLTASTASAAKLVLTAELDSHLYAFSCTQPNVDCLSNLSAVSYGGAVEVVSQLRLAGDWHAFWSTSLSWILPSGELVEELRLVSHLGVWTRHAGNWQAFILGYLGSDVGIYRETSLRQIGLGIRWAP